MKKNKKTKIKKKKKKKKTSKNCESYPEPPFIHTTNMKYSINIYRQLNPYY